MKKTTAVTAALITCMMLFCVLSRPAEAARGALDGLMLGGRVVVPSLFPFLVIGSFFVRSGTAKTVGRLLYPLTRKLFRLPCEAGAVVLMSFFAGYPVGAKMTCALLEKQSITVNQARRMLLFCINPGPAFAVSAVGISMLGSVRAGVIIYASLCLSSLAVGLLCRFLSPPLPVETAARTSSSPLSEAFVGAVSEGSGSAFSILSWILLFSCFSAVLGSFFPDAAASAPVLCLLEITNGCLSLAPSFNLPATAAALGWSGLCVLCQVLPCVVRAEMPPLLFLSGRAVHGGLAALFCRFLLHLFPCGIPAVRLGTPEVTATLCAVSVPAAIGLFVMCLLMILDLDIKKKVW